MIEIYYLNQDQDLALQNHHSYAAMSAQIMRKAGVKKAIPVHFSRRYKEEDILKILAEFNEVFL